VAVLKAEKREGTGKYVAFDLRKEGMLPAVYYGKGVENMNLAVNEKELYELIISGERIVDLDIAGEMKKAVLKDVQHESIGEGLLHADFRAIDENTAVHVDVSVELVGEAKGAGLGGVVELELHTVSVECLPANLPEVVNLDISTLGLNEVWHVTNLPALKGVKYMTSADSVVVTCHAPHKQEEAAESETAAE